MKQGKLVYKILFITLLILLSSFGIYSQTYKIVDTGQKTFFNNSSKISVPDSGEAFFGQDAQYNDFQPSYTDNEDGTITDNVTGLMWQKSFITLSWADAEDSAAAATTGGYNDWRVPTIKELYSLILFTGNQGSGPPESATPPNDAVPFIDTAYFNFEYGQTARYIDAQYVTSTVYTSTTMDGNPTFFGVNFADGRIKGYPQVRQPGVPYYGRFVRGNTDYGKNNFVDSGDNTITDKSTRLMWAKFDSGNKVFASLLSNYTKSDGSLDWEEALDFAENLSFAGYDDWRLPNAKELHSILDYTRSPDATNSPAIDSIFETSAIINEAGKDDFPAFWASTTFNPGSDAVVIFFGRALGYMDLGKGAGTQFYDVHGAGAQRTDPKVGEPSYGFGPQGDTRRVYNYVRLVRNVSDETTGIGDSKSLPSNFHLEQNYPNPFNPGTVINFSLPKSGDVSLKIYNELGEQVATVVNSNLSAGNHHYQWDASNYASGIYFYTLRTASFSETKKMMLVK
jgi:Protein of unknown function (DUF1566)/Secretion system C-terminal sorting domain